MKNQDWNNITLEKWYKIQEVLAEPDEYTGLNLIDIIYNVDSSNLPINKLKNYSIEFLKQPIGKAILKKTYLLNDTKYNSNYDLTIVTAALFIDFLNYMKEEKPRFETLLSVFFVPEGHSYNDGYDMNKTFNDLLLLDMPTVLSAAFFFEKQLAIFVKLFQHYLTKSLKKMKIDKNKKKEALELLAKTDLSSLVSYHSFYNTANQQ